MTDTAVFIINIEIVINVLSTVGVWKSWTIKNHQTHPLPSKNPQNIFSTDELETYLNAWKFYGVFFFFSLHLQDVDKWSFDVFALNEASGEHGLKFMMYELFTRYDLLSRFKVRN